MKVNSVITVLLVCLYNSIRFINCTFNVPRTLKCENKYTLTWLWNLRNNNRCLNIIIGTVFIPRCYFDQIFDSKYVITTNDLESIKSRNISLFKRTNCDNFMWFTENSTEIFELFQETNKYVKRFLPFSQIFLVSSKPDIEFDPHSLDYIYENGLFVYVVEKTLSSISSDVLSFRTLRNALTKDILNLPISDSNDVINYFGTYENHPVLNSKYKKKVFRVSLFMCSPYVIYLPDGSFDGVEYRVLKEITNDWTIEFNKCDTSKEIRDPYGAVRLQVENHESDLAVCSVWLNEKSNNYLDVTNYVNYECATFLVPKPQRLNPATYLYKSISAGVGYSIVASLITMPIICTILAKIGKKLMKNSWNDLVYISFSRSTIDTFGEITAQSFERFPKENSMKTFFIGWIIASFFFDIVFSTGYTSLLTKPPFSKPIDTIIDFLDNGLVYDRKGKSNLAKAFFDTGVDNYIQLSKRNIGDNGSDITKRAMDDKKLAHFVKILSNDYLTEITEETDPEYNLRLMKSCLFNQYTVVALQKYSTFTQYFRHKIGLLQETGIISHWRTSIEGANNNYMRPYFTMIKKSSAAPNKIVIENLSGAFWLLLSGHFLATAVLTIEYLMSSRKKVVITYVETL